MQKFLTEMEFNDEAKKMIADDTNLLIGIIKLNSTSTTIRKITAKVTWDITFTHGVEFETSLYDGRKIKSLITLDKKALTIHRIFKMKGFDATSDYKFNQEGFDLVMKAKDASVALKYERLL